MQKLEYLTSLTNKAPPKPEWPRRTSAGAFGFPPPEQPPVAPIVPQLMPAKMPPGFEQYDQLPFQQPPLATVQGPIMIQYTVFHLLKLPLRSSNKGCRIGIF